MQRHSDAWTIGWPNRRRSGNPRYGQYGHFEIGELAQHVRLYRRAIAEYRKEIRLTNYYKAHYNLGTIFGERGRYDEAIRSYQSALRQRPDLGDAYNNLGIIYRRRRQYREAIRALSQACRIDPRDPVYTFNLGFAYVSAREDRKAIAAFRRALALAPGHLDAMKNLGFLLVDMGHVPEGIRILVRARRIAPRDPEILADLTLGYLKQGGWRMLRVWHFEQGASHGRAVVLLRISGEYERPPRRPGKSDMLREEATRWISGDRQCSAGCGRVAIGGPGLTSAGASPKLMRAP